MVDQWLFELWQQRYLTVNKKLLEQSEKIKMLNNELKLAEEKSSQLMLNFIKSSEEEERIYRVHSGKTFK